MEFGIAIFWLVIGPSLVLFTKRLARENEARECYTSNEEDLIEDNPSPIKEEK